MENINFIIPIGEVIKKGRDVDDSCDNEKGKNKFPRSTARRYCRIHGRKLFFHRYFVLLLFLKLTESLEILQKKSISVTSFFSLVGIQNGLRRLL